MPRFQYDVVAMITKQGKIQIDAPDEDTAYNHLSEILDSITEEDLYLLGDFEEGNLETDIIATEELEAGE